MTDLERDEQRLVWEARKLWAKRGDVRVTMDRTAIVSPIVGAIERVSVTGAFIVVGETYRGAVAELSAAPVESLL